MSQVSHKQVITSLDIGTSKVTAMIAGVDEQDKMQVLGVGMQPSQGLKKGVIVNIDATVTAIQKALTDAQTMAGATTPSVVVNVSGGHVHSFNSIGVVAISNHEVTENDLDRVIEAAKAVAIPADQRILHILPQEFVIDNQEGISDPIGMSGVRLEAKVHMVTGSVSAAQNNIKCVRHAGLDVNDVVLSSLASSFSVLTEDEKDLGVVMIDIGGGTTDIAVFTDGAIRHSSVLPIGGNQVSNDIAHALRTPLQYAESVKLQYGVALAKLASPDETLEVRGVGDRPGKRLAVQTLATVIESRYEELFNLIYQDLTNAGFADNLAAGIVLTGGAAKLPGVVQLAQEVFRMPARIGGPQTIEGLHEVVCDPVYSTCAGLLLYSEQQVKDNVTFEPMAMAASGASTLSKVKSWFSKHF